MNGGVNTKDGWLRNGEDTATANKIIVRRGETMSTFSKISL